MCSITAPHNGKQIRCVILTFSQLRERFFKEPLDNQTCVVLELRIHRNQHWMLNRGELRGRRGQQSRRKRCIASWLCLYCVYDKAVCFSWSKHWCVRRSSPGVVLKETHPSSHAADKLKGSWIDSHRIEDFFKVSILINFYKPKKKERDLPKKTYRSCDAAGGGHREVQLLRESHLLFLREHIWRLQAGPLLGAQ